MQHDIGRAVTAGGDLIGFQVRTRAGFINADTASIIIGDIAVYPNTGRHLRRINGNAARIQCLDRRAIPLIENLDGAILSLDRDPTLLRSIDSGDLIIGVFCGAGVIEYLNSSASRVKRGQSNSAIHSSHRYSFRSTVLNLHATGLKGNYSLLRSHDSVRGAFIRAFNDNTAARAALPGA